MKLLTFIVAATLSISTLVNADDYVGSAVTFSTAFSFRGVMYHAKELISADEKEAVFFTDRGNLAIPIEEVPKALWSKYGVGERQRRTAEAAKEAARKEAGIERIYGSVVSVTNDGLLVSLSGSGKMILLRGVSGKVDGDTVSTDASPTGTFSYTTTLGAKATVRVYTVATAGQSFEGKAQR